MDGSSKRSDDGWAQRALVFPLFIPRTLGGPVVRTQFLRTVLTEAWDSELFRLMKFDLLSLTPCQVSSSSLRTSM